MQFTIMTFFLLPCLDLLMVPPGLKAGMNFSNEGLIHSYFAHMYHTTLILVMPYRLITLYLLSNTAEAKTTKGEVNLLSLLSTFDDIIEPVPEEKDRGSGSGEESKLHRTNSLEDLGIKVNSERSSISSDE